MTAELAEIESQPTAGTVSERDELEAVHKEHAALQKRVFAALFPESANGNLVKHAIRELTLAGMYDDDVDYGAGAIAENVLALVRVFASQGHSGGSAFMVRDLFTRLANYETLSPNDHGEYQDVSEMSGAPAGTWLQDTRDSRWISQDGGKTWRNVEEREPTA